MTRVPRITGQLVSFYDSFNAHQNAGYGRNTAYGIGTADATLNPDYLRIRTDAQLYPREGDAPMLFAATGASTLEFPNRGTVFRTDSFTNNADYPGTRLTIQGTPNPADPWVWKNWQHKVATSFQFTRDGDNPGMVMNFGAADIIDGDGMVTGKTGAVFSDLETYSARPADRDEARCTVNNQHCHVQSSHDISIAFGGNQPGNPNEDLAYYWKVLTPNHRNDQFNHLTGETPRVLTPGETASSQGGGADFVLTGPTYTVTEDVGSYTLELTHAATGLDPSNDDQGRYLSYAAYGLFHFLDKYTSSPNTDKIGRMQTISYGFDAYADADNMRTTDRATDMTATFKGRTIAYLVELAGNLGAIRTADNLTRMRGNISLTANIGPATNTIIGSISDLEYLGPDQHWSQEGYGVVASGGFNFANAFRPDTAVLNLTNGTINADGSYAGTVTPTTEPATYFDPGAFKGNLYGPENGLETAGTWYVPAKDAPSDIGVSGIIGSFGACQDGKGRC